MKAGMLQLRKEMKARKPDFIRQDNYRRKRVSSAKWRKPKGVHSKIRHQFKGRRKMPSPGYKSPREVRGMHPTGLKPVRIFSIEELQKIDGQKEGVIIPREIGTRKKYELLKKSREMKLAVLNINVEQHIKKIEEFVGSKKAKSKIVNKEEHKKTIKKTEQKESVTDEQKKEAEEQEKQKILTKKV